MMDISPFLQPPALSAISDIPDHQHSHDQEHQEESQEDSQGLLQSALGQVKADVISQESRRHPPSGPRANKKGVKKISETNGKCFGAGRPLPAYSGQPAIVPN